MADGYDAIYEGILAHMPKSDRPVSRAELARYLAALVEAIKAQGERLSNLEKSKPELRYVGVWTAGVEFQTGNFATHDGSVWHANEPTRSKPGTDAAWTLAVKAGRNAR